MSSQLNDSATIRAIGVDPPRRTESKRLGRALNLAEGGKKNRRKLEAKRRIEEVKDESQAHCNKRKVKSSAVVTTLLRHRGPGGVQGGGGGAPLMMRRGSNRRRRFLPAEAADRSANGRRQIDVLRSGARFASAEEPAVGDVRLIVPPPLPPGVAAPSSQGLFCTAQPLPVGFRIWRLRLCKSASSRPSSTGRWPTDGPTAKTSRRRRIDRR